MKKRIVSFVPSWTETLLEAGLDVVGRTRFCIHPTEQIASVPIVGGTKDVKWDKVLALEPDWILLDREENTLAMAKESPFPTLVTHVRSIADCARDLASVAERLDSKPLAEMADRWRTQSLAIPRKPAGPIPETEPTIPALQDWITSPDGKIDRLVYLIWKDPWMTVREDTFIGSMLARLGLGEFHRRGLELVESTARYPELDLGQLPETTLLLYSSEPYPFERKRDELPPRPGALIDGETYSWFGIRSLKFLESRRDD